MSRETVFDKLETLVFDEEVTVTYKRVSREFKIHVNAARQFLSDFLTTQKTKENISIEATYFLAGLQQKDGAKVCIVSEKSLDNAKKNLKVVTSCHIYSVSKVKPNEVVLFNTDLPYNQKNHESKELLVIKHPNIEIKSPTLSKINLLKSDAKPAVKSQNTGISKNGVSNTQKNCNNEKPLKVNSKKVEEIESQKPEETSSNTEIKKPKAEIKAQKPNTLASLWQKNEEKSKAAKNESSKPEGKGKSKSPQEIKKSLPKNNIMSMFSKQAEKNVGNSSKKTQVNDPIPVKKVEVLSPPKKAETAGLSKSEKKPSKSSNKKRKSSQKETKSSSKQDSGSDSDECRPAKKKHRRIAVFDDSDSDSDCEDIEAQDKAQRSLYLPEDPMETESPIVAPTPETDEDPIPPTPPVVSHKGRKKISKTVKKTFMDDDGFMVTTEEKEIVSESGSDEDPIPTKSSAKENKETTKSNQFTYRKQASLTNFFKRS